MAITEQPALPPAASTGVRETMQTADLRFDGFNNGFWSYLRQYHWLAIIFATFAVIVSEAVIIMLVAASLRRGNGLDIGLLGFIPLVLYVAWLYILSQRYLASNLSAFAVANGFEFDRNGTVDLSPSSLSRVGRIRTVFDVVNGNVSGHPIQLFLCNVAVEQSIAVNFALGTRSQVEDTYYITVLDILIAGHLPRLLLVNCRFSTDKLNLASGFVTKNVISLEGDFDQFFKLYAEPGTEVEALEVFSPDMMELMKNESSTFSFESVDGHIYLYMYKSIKTAVEITAMFKLAAHLTAKLAPVAARMQ